MGGTAEEANSSLNAISKALFDVHNMGKALSPELFRLQSGMGKIAATRFDTEHGVIPFMNDVAAQAQKLAAIDPQAAFRLLEGAGISEATANTMIKYGAGMGAYVSELERSLAPTREAIAAAQDLQDAWAAAQQEVVKLGSDISSDLDPALTNTLHSMTDWIHDNRDLIEQDVKGWVSGLSDAVKNFAPPQTLQALANVFKELRTDAEAVAAALTKITNWENSIAPGMARRWNDFDKFLGAPQTPSPTGQAVPIPWGDALGGVLRWFQDNWGIKGAHADELPQSPLQIQGGEVSHGNPLPVDIVRASAGPAGDPNSLLGGPLGSGGAAPAGNSGGGTQGGASRGIRDRGSSRPSLSTAQQNEAAMHMMDRLISHGWTEPAAAIAAGNAMQESGFNPSNSGDPSIPGGSHSYMQWNRDRLAALKSFAAGQGKDWQDRDVQIDFLDREARQKVPTWPSQQGLGQAREISKAYEGYGVEGARRKRVQILSDAP